MTHDIRNSLPSDPAFSHGMRGVEGMVEFGWKISCARKTQAGTVIARVPNKAVHRRAVGQNDLGALEYFGSRKLPTLKHCQYFRSTILATNSRSRENRATRKSAKTCRKSVKIVSLLIRERFFSLPECPGRSTCARRDLSVLRPNNVMCLVSSLGPVGRRADLLSERQSRGGCGEGEGQRRLMGIRGVQASIWAVASLVLAAAGISLAGSGAAADTLEWALVQAYQNNPSLNAQRAALRATDENVPQALSGYRPKVSVTAQGGYNYTNATQVFPIGGTLTTVQFAEQFLSRNVAANGTYTLFNGFQTANRTRQAESQVDGARETLRVTEQQVLLDAATAYMNLLRDQAILDLNRRNVEVLTEQLKQTRDRFNVGEVTRTDVAQAESRLAAGRSSLLGAQSNYVTSQANYRRVIGVDPGRLAPGTPVDRLSPNVLAKAVAQGQANSPSVLAAMYGVDIAALAVRNQ